MYWVGLGLIWGVVYYMKLRSVPYGSRWWDPLLGYGMVIVLFAMALIGFLR